MLIFGLHLFEAKIMMGLFVFSGFSMSWLDFYYFLHLQVQLRDLRECFKNANCALLFPLFCFLSFSQNIFSYFVWWKVWGCWQCCSWDLLLLSKNPKHKTSRDSLKWAKRNSGLQSRIKWTIMETNYIHKLKFHILISCAFQILTMSWWEPEGKVGGRGGNGGQEDNCRD